jgi:SAM-dependent methyltransferase
LELAFKMTIETLSTSVDYKRRVEAELKNYEAALEQGGLSNSIPKIFSYWAGKYLLPRVSNVFGVTKISELFAAELKAAARFGHPLRILSLGSGDCRTEIEIAGLLLRDNIKPRFICTEINEVVVSKARELISNAGLDDAFEHHVCDLNMDFPQIQFDSVIANHSLHHFLGLEGIFDYVCAGLGNGVFVINDMIGRNGHMRWPEALPFVEQIWAFLPRQKHFNAHAKCYEDGPFVNYDCTTGGDFEGVRAQDILPLLLQRFSFSKFVGFGNIPDVFLERAYGPNFSADDDGDTRFVDYLESLNNHLIDTGIVKPTMMIATLKANGRCTCSYDRWSPQFSLRRPDSLNVQNERIHQSLLGRPAWAVQRLAYIKTLIAGLAARTRGPNGG